MTLSNLAKDVGQIYSRLFDHSPALKGDCRYFYDEFEGNGRAAEFDHILQTSHVLNEAVETNVEARLKTAHVDKISTKLDAIAAMLMKTVKQGEAEVYSTYLSSHQEKIDNEFSAFEAEIERKKADVDMEIEQHIQDVRNHLEHYEQLHLDK